MAGSKVNLYAVGDVDLTAMMSALDATRKGFSALTLTHMSDTTVPAIAAGSNIEVNGGLYSFASEEAISTTDPVTSAAVANGSVYVMLIPSGDTISAAFTATAPVWSDAKQGWYGTGNYTGCRYIAFLTKSASLYYGKKRLLNSFENQFKWGAFSQTITYDENNITALTSFQNFTIVDGNMVLSGGRILIPITGVYDISFYGTMSFGVGHALCNIYKNSAVFLSTAHLAYGYDNHCRMSRTFKALLTAGDLVYGYMSTGGSSTDMSSEAATIYIDLALIQNL